MAVGGMSVAVAVGVNVWVAGIGVFVGVAEGGTGVFVGVAVGVAGMGVGVPQSPIHISSPAESKPTKVHGTASEESVDARKVNKKAIATAEISFFIVKLILQQALLDDCVIFF